MAADDSALKQLLVLVGPRGSGKTTLGRMLEQRLGARFVYLDRVAQRVLGECNGKADDRYVRRAFHAMLAEIAKQALNSDLLVIESTGASSESEAFFGALRERYEVLFVRVHAERTTCDARASDPDIPRDVAARMYELSSGLSLPWDLELDNDGGLDARTLADAVRPLLRN